MQEHQKVAYSIHFNYSCDVSIFPYKEMQEHQEMAHSTHFNYSCDVSTFPYKGDAGAPGGSVQHTL